MKNKTERKPIVVEKGTNTHLLQQAKQVISKAGSPKTGRHGQFYERREGHRNPYATYDLRSTAYTDERLQLQEEMKMLSRAVMRNPSQEADGMLLSLHVRMKEEFLSCSDEEIEWLLGGAIEMAHGGFKDAASFRAFLNTDPTIKSPHSRSRLITGIETIGTAIGYRMIQASWAKAPTAPEYENFTPDQLKMYTKVMDIRYRSGGNDADDMIVRSIGDVYVNRYRDDVGKVSKLPHDIESFEDTDLSDASDVDDKEEKQPQKYLPNRRFQKHADDDRLSWVGAAHESKIDVRAHVSGTAPLALAGLEGLLRVSGEGKEKIIADDDSLRQLAGVLLLPTFARGDYHTIAETGAGVEHYIAERHKNDPSDTSSSKPLSPRMAFEKGLGMLAIATKPTTAFGEGKKGMNLQQAIEIVSRDILSRTGDEEAQLEKQTAPPRV